MEGTGDLTFYGVNPVKKKVRSSASRRPRADSQFFHASYDFSPTLASEAGSFSKVASDDNWGDDVSYKQKELRSINGLESESTTWTSNSEDSKGMQNNEKLQEFDDTPKGVSGKYYRSCNAGLSGSQFKRISEGVLAPANWKGSSSQKQNQFQSTESENKRLRIGSGESDRNGRRNSGLGGDSVGVDSGGGASSQDKLRKVKLKVAGVAYTIRAKPTSNSGGNGRISSFGSSGRQPCSSDLLRQQQKLRLRDKSNGEGQSSTDSENGRQGVPWEDLKGVPGSVRKSKRVPKKCVLDHDYDSLDNNEEEEEDGELQYLGRLKSSKANVSYGAEYDNAHQAKENHKQKSSRASKKCGASEFDKLAHYEGGTLSLKGRSRKGKSRDADDLYRIDEEENGFTNEDDEAVSFNFGSRRKKPKMAFVHSSADDKDIRLTTRQRALQSANDPSSGVGSVQFPDGLPSAAPKRQKEKLADMEQQLKKAEAAQRRRMQVEKAARESEAQAIRKILGQDANGKKREDKLRKRKEEMAQEKAARAMASDTVRWTMGPLGTVVSFPEDVGLPCIFSSQSCSYPPPRVKCAGPSCTNTYKYRDSKSNLPLCSLECYKSVNKSMEPVASC